MSASQDDLTTEQTACKTRTRGVHLSDAMLSLDAVDTTPPLARRSLWPESSTPWARRRMVELRVSASMARRTAEAVGWPKARFWRSPRLGWEMMAAAAGLAVIITPLDPNVPQRRDQPLRSIALEAGRFEQWGQPARDPALPTFFRCFAATSGALAPTPMNVVAKSELGLSNRVWLSGLDASSSATARGALSAAARSDW